MLGCHRQSVQYSSGSPFHPSTTSSNHLFLFFALTPIKPRRMCASQLMKNNVHLFLRQNAPQWKRRFALLSTRPSATRPLIRSVELGWLPLCLNAMQECEEVLNEECSTVLEEQCDTIQEEQCTFIIVPECTVVDEEVGLSGSFIMINK